MNNKPLTLEEVQSASDLFFPLFNEISQRMPNNSTVEDKLKVMESVCNLAQKLRMEEQKTNFGFNKNERKETN